MDKRRLMVMREIDRRAFLTAATAAGVSVMTEPLSAWQGASRNYIDAHSHIWEPETDRYSLAPGNTKADLDPPSFTPEELLATCQPHGVERVVLIQHTIYHRFDNSYITDTIARFPKRFSGVAVVDDHGERPADEMLQLKSRGIRGFRIVPRDWHGDQGPVAPEKWLAGEGMKSMWKAAGENGLAMCPLIHPEYLPVIDTMCSQFPDTNVVVDHFARCGIDGTIRNEDVDKLCVLAKHKRTHVKVSAFYALGKKAPPYTDLIPMIRRVLDAFGPERLMWASDCPYQVQGDQSYAASVNLIKSGIASLSDGDKEWLLRKTAEHVYFS